MGQQRLNWVIHKKVIAGIILYFKVARAVSKFVKTSHPRIVCGWLWRAAKPACCSKAGQLKSVKKIFYFRSCIGTYFCRGETLL